MNDNIRKLYKISSKKSRVIVGLMSGTSLDGLDIALCNVSGSGTKTKAIVKRFITIPYDDEIRKRILNVFAKSNIEFRQLSELNAWLAITHGNMILSALAKWKVKTSSVDIIASHGQTVFHAPMAVTHGVSVNSTLQIGDGDHIAVITGITTLSDFRQKHVAAGGEGAPLAVYGDYLLFSKKNEDRIMLNIGGIGNFTFLPSSLKRDKVFVTDIGPGNTMIDQAMRFYFSRPFDKDGLIASSGSVNEKLLTELKRNPFFDLPFPKTTGPEQFNLDYLGKAQKSEVLAGEDIIATLTRFSAETIAEAIKIATNNKPQKIFLSGGGAHNPIMTRWISELLPNCRFSTTSELGIDGDAKEAVLFAVLANEALAGGDTNFGNRTKVPSVSMGKVSFPK